MADLGIKSGVSNPIAVQNEVEKNNNPVQDSAAPIKSPANQASAEKSIAPSFKVNERPLVDIRNSNDADDFNLKAKIENLAEIYSKFKPVRSMTGVFENFLGQFTGEIKLYVEDQRALPTTVSFVNQAGEIEFDVNISDSTMFKTEFKGTSKPESLFNSVDGSSAVFLAIDHYGSKYLQLYYTGSQQMLVGNFYKKWDKPGEMKPLGSVRLRRR